jgi:3',5'-cyclic AMP phosphodiesterase CpdA
MTKKNPKTSALAIMLVFGLLLSSVAFLSPKVQGEDWSTSFSIMQITDTQYLSGYFPKLFNTTMTWLVDNAPAYNVKMVVHTGDLVDNETSPSQWEVANASISKLIQAGIPYCWAAGNHDQIPENNPNGTCWASNYYAFNAANMRSKPYWVSDLYGSKNTAVKVEYGGVQFLIVDIEYLGNSSVLAWAKNLFDNYPNANVIAATHSYLNNTLGYGSSDLDENAWIDNFKTLINSYPRASLILSGHDPFGSGSNNTRIGLREEIYYDRQAQNSFKGAASVRIYTFNTVSMTVNVRTYAVDTQQWLTDLANQFSFGVSTTQGTYRDWQVQMFENRVYLYPPAGNTRFPTIQSIGSWNAEYYGKLGWSPIDATKPYIDYCMTLWR